MEKIPLIVWSGGADSTSIVLDNVSSGIKFDTLYVLLENNKEKSDRERHSISLIKEKLMSIFGNEVGIQKELTVSMPEITPPNNVSFFQPLLWAMAIQLTFDNERHSHVEMGYIRTDDFWHKSEYFKDLLSAGSGILSRSEPILVKFPLEWCRKVDIINRYQDHKEIYELTTWCEEPDPTPNCLCRPCITHRMALKENELY